jgi:two-component system alkaline phosphatase synthesis response regulator PhoP
MSKILIVDDDKAFTDSTAAILQKAGFEVICANTPEDGLAKATNDKPNLVLLDVTLKSTEDGLALGKQLVAKGINVPIIVLENVTIAASFGTDISDLAIEAYAEKPLDSEKILKKIGAIMGR